MARSRSNPAGSSSHSRSRRCSRSSSSTRRVSGTTPALQPSNLAGHTGTVSLTGKVIGPLQGDAHRRGGLRFKLHNINGASPTVPIVYHGSVPDLFKVGRDVNVTGTHAGRRVRRDGPDDEVPEQVHVELADRRWLISAAQRSSSASGWRSTRSFGGTAAALTPPAAARRLGPLRADRVLRLDGHRLGRARPGARRARLHLPLRPRSTRAATSRRSTR